MKKVRNVFAVCVLCICAFLFGACDFAGGGMSSGSSSPDPATCRHTYGSYLSDNNATCTQDGTKTAVCSICGNADTVSDVGSKLPHTFEFYSYDNNASCTQGGTKTAYCTVCNTPDTVADDRHPIQDHRFTDYKSDNNATCDANGTKTAVCDTCKTAVDTVEEAGTAGHRYVNGACSICRASHLIYKPSGNNYTVGGIAEDCTATEIVIPATENGKPVVGIADTAFKDNTAITEITLPDSVWLIGYGSFDGCTALETVTFGKGLTAIRGSAFAGCTSLEHIAFPETLRELGGEVLADCTNLKTVEFGKTLASLPSDCFDGCTALESVGIAEENPSFSVVDGIVYRGKTSLTSIVYVPHAISGKVALVDGFTKIETSSFQNRTRITGIYIPLSVHTINSFAFSGCSSLTDLYYQGSEEEWNTITKNTNWSSGATFTVHYLASRTE